MMNTRVIEVPVTILGEDVEVELDSDKVFSIDSLTLFHVQSPCDMANQPIVTFYRKVPVIDGCSVDEFCYYFGSTCDDIFLPPGEYMIDVEVEGAKYTPDGQFGIVFAFEEVSRDYTLATQLNALGGC